MHICWCPLCALHYIKKHSRRAILGGLRWANRAIVIAESLERVIAAIRITSVRGGHISPQNTEISPHRPCVRCAAMRIAR